MSVKTTTKITILARVEDSAVLNEIGTVLVDTRWRAASAADDNAAMDVTGIVDIDVVQMLRDVADEIEASAT